MRSIESRRHSARIRHAREKGATMPTRREFISKAGATVTLLMIPIGCSSENPSPTEDAGGTKDSGGGQDASAKDANVADVNEASVADTGAPACGATSTSTVV